MKLTVEITQDTKKLDQQLRALEYAIKNDTNEKDKQIHLRAYNILLEAKLREETA